MSFYTNPNMNIIGMNYILNKPAIYASNFPPTFNNIAPNWQSVLSGNFITLTPATNFSSLSTIGGVIVQTFAKNGKWNQSLYEDLVQPTLQFNAMWETWQNGDTSNKMPSFCTPQYKWNSQNITKVNLTSTIGWLQTKDHSKWGISTTGTQYVCIGDINRQWSQNTRGGGTACISQPNLWSSFNSLVTGCACCAAT